MQIGNKIVVFAALSLAGSALVGLPAHADIEFEEKGKRFSLDVRDEPIAKVMDELSERFEFDVDGYPEHWSDDPISFTVTGDLERVLQTVLKDTSHVFEYHTDLETRETRIASLRLLNEGVEGFVPSQASSSGLPDASQSASATAAANGQNGPNAAGSNRDSLSSTRDLLEADLPTDSNGTAVNNPPAGVSQSSGLSQTLAARARQASTASAGSAPTAGTTTPSARSSSTGAPSTNPVTNVSEADMQALTQKALRDVRGLAEALKKAEGK